jgi:methylthioribulose-1-phosphate dehydratase
MSAKTTEPSCQSNVDQSALAELLIDAGQDFYRRGWMLGTSGNLSAVVSSDPLTLAITASGAAKGALSCNHILQIDGLGNVKQGEGRSSDETKLHLAVVGSRQAGSVFHTHSVWSTLLSDAFASRGSLLIEGFEMLKGLSGVSTHEHSETVPIIENSQDMEALSVSLEEALTKYPKAHGVLLRRHGLYTWGRDAAEARRHVEILEFLFEVIGRAHFANPRVTL